MKYVDQMNEVDTSNVKPMTQVIDFVNVMREDVPCQEISKEALMSNARMKKTDSLKFLKSAREFSKGKYKLSILLIAGLR